MIGNGGGQEREGALEPEVVALVLGMHSRTLEAVDRFRSLVPEPPQRRYVGPLTPDLVDIGVRATLANARELLADAERLLEHARYPRAAGLAVLALEECWKGLALGLYNVLVSPYDPATLRLFWNQYRNHSFKSGTPGSIGILGRTFNLDELPTLTIELGPRADHLKQITFYADYLQETGNVRAVAQIGRAHV